jgi:hypothetical protein
VIRSEARAAADTRNAGLKVLLLFLIVAFLRGVLACGFLGWGCGTLGRDADLHDGEISELNAGPLKFINE